MIMIEGADLTFYLDNGDNFSVALSPTQLAGIIKLLGLTYNVKDDTFSMFSDESLQNFMDKTINKWEKA